MEYFATIEKIWGVGKKADTFSTVARGGGGMYKTFNIHPKTN